MELVKIENKQVVTSSLEISKSFGKQHYHVIRDIENIQKDISNFGEMFYKGKYKDSYNRNQKYEFNDKYHLVPIKLTEEIGKKYNLSKNNLTERHD